jgi:DNA (cytosine-5)-methyltransferase 1
VSLITGTKKLKATNSKNGHGAKSSSGLNTTVELFCGIGGFRIAADAVGLKTIWANDIEPKACQAYRDQFGSPLKEGDIHDFLGEIPPHDVLSGGFPCQPFSSAGKKLGVRDPRGTLFQAIVQVIERHQPRFFVLENVKRLLSMEQGCHFATILTALAGIGYRIEWRQCISVSHKIANAS